MTDLSKSMNISAAGMKAQGTRLRVISENIANAGSTGLTPNDEPYRRKLVTFGRTLDRELGTNLVDGSDFSASHRQAVSHLLERLGDIDIFLEPGNGSFHADSL